MNRAMYLKLIWLLILLRMGPLKDALGAKILAIMLVPATSHHLWYSKYLEALRQRGHSITYVGVERMRSDLPNLRHVTFDKLRDDLFPTDYMLEYSNVGPIETTLVLDKWDHSISSYIKKSVTFQHFLKMIKTESFDLVVHDLGACIFMLGAVELLKNPPVMGIAPFSPSWVLDILKNPVFYSSHPHYLISYGEEMSFFERVHNYLVHLFSWGTRSLYMIEQNKHAKDAFGEDLKPLEDTMNRMNIILMNSNDGLDFSYPKAPGLIHVGGLHIEPPKQLPKDLGTFLGNATDGFIYFSLGTNILTSSLRKDKIDMFLSAFNQLAPIKVLWKWERDEHPNLPQNVKMTRWAPQNDILAHQRILLFITHCGRLSMQEAVHHGVPILGMPFTLDQPANLKKCIEKGIAEELDYRTLSTEVIVEKIRTILKDPKYRENSKRLSAIVRDTIDRPLDRAVFWTEYAIRHKGAHHLGLFARKMMWYENAQLDVYLFFVLVLLYVLFIVYKVLQFLSRKLRKEDIKTKTS